MVKHASFLILFSILAVMFQAQLAHSLTWLMLVHNKVAAWLTFVFSSDSTGIMIRNVIALILLPVAVGSAIALVFFIIKKHSMRHLLLAVWIVWTVLLVTMLAQMG